MAPVDETLEMCEGCGDVFDEDDLSEAGYCHDCAAYHDDDREEED